MDFAEFSKKAHVFLESLFKILDEKNIVLEKHWSIDHLCYRTSSLQQYQDLKTIFESFAELLIESDVNGRPIATYKFAKPIQFRDWHIQVVELPAPKPGKVTIEGFEHIEVVSDLSFSDIQKRYPQCDFDSSGLKKDFNQELEIPLGSYALKFHPLSLESVVRLESNKKVYQALQESQVLKRFRHYNPLVAGTFPLGVFNEKSDLDILLQSSDFEVITTELIDAYGELSDFEIKETDVEGDPTIIVNFTVNAVPFEIFVQNKDTVTQVAYRHFLVEERLLALGQDVFLEKVKLLRSESDLKTEPAFAKALGLVGPGYSELLHMQKKSEAELLNTFIKLNV